MKDFLFTHGRKQGRSIGRLFSLLLIFLSLISFFACQRKTDYFDYVSELRNNIFLAKTEEFSLRIHSLVKESPYASDGVARERSARFEAYLVAPEGNKKVDLVFQIDENSYGGEMSYDNVKGEYYYFCSLDVATRSTLPCLIQYGDREVELTANSVLTETTISPREALKVLQKENAELFSTLTDKYGFAGEIYLRLIYEGSPYYYIGIIDRNGKCNAFLMNAETGKILAKRES